MAEITVRGAGITGLMCAWMLAQRGLRVQVIDPGGVAAGASGGIVGALAPHVPENWNPKKEMQFQALDAAEALWAQIAEVGGEDPGYARTGRVQPVPDRAAIPLAEARAKNAETLWRGRYMWSVDSADAFGIPSPTGLVIHDSLTARIQPRQACLALAAALRAQGVLFHREGPRQGVEVWATGTADLEAISAARGKQVGTAIKGQAALLRAEALTAPQIFADGLHIVPHGDGTVAIGSTTERVFDDPATTDALLEPLVEKARRTWPLLADAPVIARWAGLRPRARSRAPMVGPHPLQDGAYVANGGFKIGLAMAPVVATMLADLIVDGVDTIPDLFRPEASL